MIKLAQEKYGLGRPEGMNGRYPSELTLSLFFMNLYDMLFYEGVPESTIRKSILTATRKWRMRNEVRRYVTHLVDGERIIIRIK